MKGYHSKLEGTLEVKEVDEDDDDNDTDNLQDDFDSGGEQVAFLGYTVAKVPTYCSVHLSDLVDQYGTDDIVSQLTNFLQRSPLTSRSARLPSLTSAVSVYKCVTVRLPPAPQVSAAVTKDMVHACPATPAWGLIPAVPAQFDTVLARESAEEEEVEHPLDGEDFDLILCLHVASCPLTSI